MSFLQSHASHAAYPAVNGEAGRLYQMGQPLDLDDGTQCRICHPIDAKSKGVRYSIIRACPDIIAEEFVNIGIVAHDGDSIDFCLLHDWTRATAFICYRRDFDWLVFHVTNLKKTLRRWQDYQDVPALLEWARLWNADNAICFTPWRGSAAPFYGFCRRIAGTFLKEPEP